MRNPIPESMVQCFSESKQEDIKIEISDIFLVFIFLCPESDLTGVCVVWFFCYRLKATWQANWRRSSQMRARFPVLGFFKWRWWCSWRGRPRFSIGPKPPGRRPAWRGMWARDPRPPGEWRRSPHQRRSSTGSSSNLFLLFSSNPSFWEHLGWKYMTVPKLSATKIVRQWI